MTEATDGAAGPTGEDIFSRKPSLEANPDIVRTIMSARWQDIPTSQLTTRMVEMRRLADSMRIIIERLVATAAPTEAIIDAADELARVALAFDRLPQGSKYEGFSEAANAGGEISASFEHSPLIGRANPLSPPLSLHELDGKVHARGVFGSAYEGPPGCVHGGYVAAAFDEVLGATQSLSGAPGMTGRLTVHYRSPTPLHETLHFVGQLTGVEGRKIYTEGQLFAGERLCAEAEGLFVSIDVNKWRGLMEERERQAAADAAGS
jgi:acyl-coenzyme A thioesterase PaaI-like protein